LIIVAATCEARIVFAAPHSPPKRDVKSDNRPADHFRSHLGRINRRSIVGGIAVQLYKEPETAVLEPPFDPTFPPEVEMILSAMEAGAGLEDDRRVGAREAYRTKAILRLFADAPNHPGWVLFGRDIDRKTMGFITPHLLPLGYGGNVTLYGPDGQLVRSACTLIRCRKAIDNWYEGALNFNKPLWQFD
jgi:hypothetical protein